MAQTIKIKRGGLASLVAATPTLAQGELLLATGSLNGLGSTFFVADDANTPELPYAKIESVANGATLASSLDGNFNGLLIHSASDNKLYRYNGTTFVELPIAAGSFEGILPVVNGGTGQDTLDDIVGDGKIIVQNGTETIIGGDAVLTLGGGVVTGSEQINGANILNNTVGFGGVSVALGSSDDTPAFNLQDATGYPGDSNLVTLGTVTAGDVSAILPAGTVSGSVQITISDTTGYTTFSSSIATDIETLQGNSGTTTNALEDGDGIQDFTFDGSAGSVVVAVEAAQTSITSVKNNSLVIGSATGNDIIDFGTGGNVIIKTNNVARVTVNDNGTTIAGDLTVTGTTTSINSTNLDIGDNIISLNGAAGTDGGLQVNDATGTTTSGSLLWKTGNDYWVAGALASEKRIPLQDNDMAANSFVIATGAGTIDDVTPSTIGDILQWNGTSLVASNEIDGGTF